jgi:penicillin-binding protein-related factor A (putative recombinase)
LDEAEYDSTGINEGEDIPFDAKQIPNTFTPEQQIKCLMQNTRDGYYTFV